MLTSIKDDVITLLAGIGFAVEKPEDIVIADFDQWKNPDTGGAARMCASGVTVDNWTEVAA